MKFIGDILVCHYKKEVLIMIWCLGNIESFRSVADRFGISKSTCWDVLYRSCNLLMEINTKYFIIAWPTNDRAAKIIREFHTTGFPSKDMNYMRTQEKLVLFMTALRSKVPIYIRV